MSLGGITRRLLSIAVSLAQTALALIAAFDAAVAAAAILRPPRHLQLGPRRRRFAVLVPARDEAAVIRRAISSLCSLEYPRECFEVLVVADNCGDDTASIARQSGVRVFERREQPPGKAAALGWLVHQLPADSFDAFAVVDADSVVSRNLLDVMDASFEAGYDAVQVHDGALNSMESPLAALAGLGLELNNGIRAAGRQALGLSPGLMGNGMGITARAWAVVDWGDLGITEDSDAQLALLRAGCRIRYDPGASALSDMATGWVDTRTQNVRWDTGRMSLVRDQPGRPHGSAVGSFRYALVVVDQALPRSVLYASNLVLLAVLTLLRRRGRLAVALAVLGAQGLSVAPALIRVQPRQLILALRAAPAFLAWKCMLFAGLIIGRPGGPPSSGGMS